MNYIKNIALFLLISLIIVYISNYIGSTFLLKFLVDDLITILITIFAINTATNSFLINDLSNLAKAKNIKFQNSYKQIKISIKEQVVLIAFGFILLIFRESQIMQNKEVLSFIIDTLILCIFIYSIDILRDTAIAIFKLIEFKNSENQ